MAKKEWEAENAAKYFATWTTPGGNIEGEIDYLAVSAKYRNTVRKAQSNIY